VQTQLQPGMGYSTQLGQRHRLIGITDCDIVEVSTPEQGTTWRLEDDYARPDETPEQRDKERSIL
jgi:mannose-6-phosphate isomerase